MQPTPNLDPASILEIVRKCVFRELESGSPLPDDELDLLRAEVIDSMGWVGILSAVEEATGIRDFGQEWPATHPQSIRSLVDAVRERASHIQAKPAAEASQVRVGPATAIYLTGWGEALGSLAVDAGEVERECGLPPGTISAHAGVRSVRRAKDGQDEVTLGQTAAEIALNVAGADTDAVNFLVATSATFLKLPSLSAVLHTRLLMRKSCGAFDVGGACVGTLYALSTARALLTTSGYGVALVVASEVHSRRLSRPSVPGEFRGLFGDGACAFVLNCSGRGNERGSWRLGDFTWGCFGTFASVLGLALQESGELDVQFKGGQLASAAVSQMDELLDELEVRSGRPRSEVDYFALHEPNPRLVALLADRAKIPLAKIPQISENCGNLGSATCGVSLCTALTKAQIASQTPRKPMVFVAALGPGLLRGGTYLERASGDGA